MALLQWQRVFKLGGLKVLHPTCLYMQKYFQMAPTVNIYTHEYPITSKYHMLPTHLRGEISTQKIAKSVFSLDWQNLYGRAFLAPDTSITE